MKSINILFPVLNEQIRLKNGICKTVEYMDKNVSVPYVLTIVDNGSTDETPQISNDLCTQFPQVKYLRTKEKGVGLAFRTGVSQNTSEIVGYMDVDLSTDIKHIADVIRIFDSDASVQMVNGSRLNRKSNTTGRKWYRNITSHGLTSMLKIFLGLKASDSICGFKFFKKELAQELIQEASDDNGWFYIIELLLRAEKKGVNIVELPVRWEDDYNTTVKVFKLIKYYIKQIMRLRKVFKSERYKR